MTTLPPSPLPQPAPEDDPTLIARCVEGDEAAWSALVARYNRLVFAVARRAGLSQEDAEDTFQVVFTTLYRRLEGLRDQERLAAWLITTTHREAVRLRRQIPTQDVLGAETPTEESATEEVIERELQSQTVRDAVAALDERCATLIRSLFLEADQAYSAIADQLGIAVGSIGPTRARCLAKLRSLLDARGFSAADIP